MLFWLWRALPDPGWVVYLFLTLASLAVALVVPMVWGLVRLPLAIPACAALGAYFAYFPVQLPLFSGEAWSAIGALAVTAALARALASPRWKSWTIASVALALLAITVRESAAWLLIAGLVSSFAVPSEKRRFYLLSWAGGALAAAAVYAAHVTAVRPLLTYADTYDVLFKGGLDNLGAAVVYATDFIGQGTFVPWLLFALGLLGIVLIPERSYRLFAGVAVLGTFLSFLVIGNNAWYWTSGATLNYWGASIVPLVYAFVPIAFTLVPGAVPSSAAAAENRVPGRPVRASKPATVRSR